MLYAGTCDQSSDGALDRTYCFEIIFKAPLEEPAKTVICSDRTVKEAYFKTALRLIFWEHYRQSDVYSDFYLKYQISRFFLGEKILKKNRNCIWLNYPPSQLNLICVVIFCIVWTLCEIKSIELCHHVPGTQEMLI